MDGAVPALLAGRVASPAAGHLPGLCHQPFGSGRKAASCPDQPGGQPDAHAGQPTHQQDRHGRETQRSARLPGDFLKLQIISVEFYLKYL